ncbi:MAG: M20/M25/M40 family metallo-hydrolase [Bacteroidia bacterium]|nr:M20/M25/M40 family metallo-hydrolase [Bacteroidia bacterium]
MEINFELLKRLSEIPGISGFEQPIRSFVISVLNELGYQSKIDSLGNLLVEVKGIDSSRKAVAAAHLDEIGFIITHLNEQGFARFHTVGGFDPKTLVAQRVIAHGKQPLIGVMGSKPIHVMSEEDKAKRLKTTDFYIDFGLPGETVKENLFIGTPVTRDRELIWLGNCLNGKSLDNRISVYVLLETLRLLKETPPAVDFWAVFSVQEEVGTRGAWVAAHTLNPDFAFGIDTTIAFDTPDAAEHERITSLGKGTAIKIMDGGVIADSRMVAFMKQQADEAGIEWQPEILPAGGTDTAPLQRAGKSGAIAGCVSIPTRHIHSTIESVHKHDVIESIKLLTRCLQQLHTFSAQF